MTERIETDRIVAAPAAAIFALLCDPQGHVAIDSSGMLQDAEGEPVTAVGDTFKVKMDRESLNDFPELGKYDVTVTIRDFEPEWRDAGIFPVLSENALRGTLGILDRTVRRGYSRG